MGWLLKLGTWAASMLLGKGVVERFTAPLLAAYQAKLNAANDKDKIEAETTITRLEAARDIAVTEARDRWSATSMGRWLIVVPFGMWWAAIYLVQILNPWIAEPFFGTTLTVVDVPARIHEMALILIPAIVIADAGALFAKVRR